MQNLATGLGSGAGLFTVGSVITPYIARGTNIALTSDAFGTTIIVDATTEIDITLWDATTSPSTSLEALGLYVVGAAVNLRDKSGRLLASFIGRKTSLFGKSSSLPAVGAVIGLADISTAAGKWVPKQRAGMVVSPRWVGPGTFSTNMLGSLFSAYDATDAMITTNAPSFPYRFNQMYTLRLSAYRAAVHWLDSTSGKRIMHVEIDPTTKQIAPGTPTTYETYTSGDANICGMNVTGGKETALLCYTDSSSSSKYRAVEFNASAMTFGTAVSVPNTDNNGNTLAQFLGMPGMCAAVNNKVLVTGRQVNSTGSYGTSYAAFVSTSGTTVTAGVPQRLGPASSYNPLGRNGMLAFDSNTRVGFGPDKNGLVFADTTGAAGMVVLDISGSVPTKSYTVAASACIPGPAPFGYTNFDTASGYVYAPRAESGSPRYVKFKIGTAAITDVTDCGESSYTFNAVIGTPSAFIGFGSANYPVEFSDEGAKSVHGVVSANGYGLYCNDLQMGPSASRTYVGPTSPASGYQALHGSTDINWAPLPKGLAAIVTKDAPLIGPIALGSNNEFAMCIFKTNTAIGATNGVLIIAAEIPKW